MPYSDERRLCIVHLSCIGQAVKYMLPLSDEFYKRYRLVAYNPSAANRLGTEIAIPQSQLDECDIYIYHNSDWIQFSTEELDAYETALSRIPDRVQKITFPLPHFLLFWPFHCSDPRNEDERRPVDRQGNRPSYPLGDSYVLDCIKQGIPAEEIIAKYCKLDLAKHLDLDQYLQWSLLYLERNERSCEIKTADYIASTFRSRKLFSQINHANNTLMLHGVNQALRLMGCGQIPDSILEQLQLLVGYEIPVHPSIARYFNISYFSEDTRYRIDATRFLTFSEFIRQYVYFS